jgi:hypothetical protein
MEIHATVRGFSDTSKTNELAKRKYQVPLPRCEQLVGENVQEINRLKKNENEKQFH